MKRVALFTLIALALSGCVLLVVHPPRQITGLILWALFAFANKHPPAIADGQMTEQDWVRADAGRKFTAVLARKFPQGTSETALKSILLGEGFRVPDPPPRNCIPPGQSPPVGVVYYQCLTEEQEKARQKTLVYGWSLIFCGNEVSVRWSADDHGRITNIEGTFRQTCL